MPIFIHGTNALILPFLQITGFKLLSPIQLMRNHGVAPINGEIDKGGLSGVSDCPTCFGTLVRHDSCTYTLDKLLTTYTQFKNISLQDRLKKVEEKIENINKLDLSVSYPLLIEIARLKQQGLEISPKEKNLVKRKIEEICIGKNSQCYFWLVCAKIIKFDKDLLKKASDHYWEFQLTLLEEKDRLKYLKENPEINFKHLYDELCACYPTIPDSARNTLEHIKNMFGTEARGYHDDGLKYIGDFIKLMDAQNSAVEGFANERLLIHPFNRSNNFQLRNFTTHLINSTEVDLKLSRFIDIKQINNIIKIIEMLKDCLCKVFDAKSSFNEEQIRQIKDDFPLIFVHTNNHLVKAISSEYRAVKELLIGEDINIIATDTTEHQHQLCNMLSKHGIYGVSIMLIEDLQDIKQRIESDEHINMNDLLQAKLASQSTVLKSSKFDVDINATTDNQQLCNLSERLSPGILFSGKQQKDVTTLESIREESISAVRPRTPLPLP